MAEEPAAEKAALQESSASNKSWITSFVLVLLTLVVAVACVVALACTLTQTRVAALTIDGVGISIPKLDYVGREWAAQRASERDEANLERIKSEANLDRDDANTRMVSNRIELTNKIAIVVSRVEITDFGLAKTIASGDDFIQRYTRIIGRKEEFVEKDKTLAGPIKDVEAAYDSFRDAASRYEKLTTYALEVGSNLTRLQERNAKRSKTLFDYIKPDFEKDKEAKARVENAFYELNIDKFQCGKGKDTECGPIGGLVARGLYHILTLRPDLLTLCLVILMGILGSTLQITHSYFMKNEKQDIGGYFQRVAVGAMTALVIFIVAKAGVPVIADTSRLGGDAPINPYLVSFLAIISGLLSENAIANIQAQGRRYLGADGGGPKRWARDDLTKKLEGQNMSSEALAGHLGVDKSIAAAMLKGTSAMDAQQQKIVALSLRENPRAIFTDIAPPTAAPAAPG